MADNGEPERVDAVVGEPVTVSLGPMAANGFEWQHEVPAGVHLVESGARPPGPGQPGGVSAASVTLVPEAEGTYLVTLRLVRPWQADQPMRERVIELVVRAH